jgi:hypothetical protein
MQNMAGHSMTVAALTVAMLVSGAAFAKEPTAHEKAELAQLSPGLRSQVEARLIGDQTVRGVLDTMLLNNISLKFATNRVVAVDFDNGMAVVEGKNNQIELFPFDVVTLAIKK